jgi:hypothetical protein
MKPLCLACLVTFAFAGCAQGSTAPVRVRFTLGHRTVVVHVGDRLAVQKSAGECQPPRSTDVRVLAPIGHPSVSCTGGVVVFRALRRGRAKIMGQLPCSGTGCAAVLAWIPVVVEPSRG